MAMTAVVHFPCQAQEDNSFDTRDYVEYAFLLSQIGEYEKADTLFTILRQIMKDDADDAAIYAHTSLLHADAMKHLQRIDEAEAAIKEAENIALQLMTDDYYKEEAADIYTEALSMLANLYMNMSDYESSIAYLRKALDYYEQLPAVSARQLSSWIPLCSNPLATDEPARMVALIESIKPGDDFITLAVAADAYLKNNDIQKALSTACAAENIYEGMSDEEKQEMVGYAIQMYTATNDIESLIDCCDIQLADIEQSLGKGHSLYIESLFTKSGLCSLAGRYGEASQIINTCIELVGPTPDLQAQQAEVAFYMGNNYYAINAAKQCINATDDIQLANDMMELITYCLIGETEICSLDNDEKAKTNLDSLRTMLREQALQYVEFCDTYFGAHHINTIMALGCLASAYYLTGETEEMMATTQLCEGEINTYVPSATMRRSLLSSLTACYMKAGDYDKALSLTDTLCLADPNALPIEKEFTLFALAEINLRAGDTDKAQEYYSRLSRLLMSMTSKQMTMLPAAERMPYWRLYRQTLTDAGKYIDTIGEPSPFAGVVYNLALYSKGLLLNSDANFRRAILSTNDSEQTAKMRYMLNLRSWLAQNKEIDGEEYAYISRQANEIERELLADNASLLSGLTTEQADWQEVGEALDRHSIAIEMVEYKDLDDNDMYGAVMLKREWSSPVFCVLGGKTAIDSVLADPKQCLSRGDIVWAPMTRYLNGVSNIYLSPTGIFHKVPVEYMSCGNISDMSDHFNIYRLSSTADIITNHDNHDVSAVVYGGLIYDTDVNSLIADARQYRPTVDNNNHDNTVERGNVSLPYLEWSKAEADTIVAIINNAGNDCHAIEKTGTLGSEASLKALSGSPTTLLHIATHGFYSNDKEKTGRWLSDPNKDSEDKALTRSGLYMAGALNKYMGIEIPDTIDDGILTAQEISALDFRNVDIVSLSACETARGDISSDGVFGLQRGFKIAGARSVLMSLWKVNDKAAATFMSVFYSSLLSGHSKCQSLNIAKNAVRSQSQWNSPEYWASFILLDGE